MPQLLVAGAGAWAGNALLGGVLGSSLATGIGWTAGSLLGAKWFGPDPASGPRITDGTFSNSVYGQSIPISYATMRHKAQPIWFSGLHESSRRVGDSWFSSGVRVYSYSCDLMVSVCEGPVGAVLRIWANGRLIWRNDGSVQGAADGEVISAANVRIYLGDEEQEPDPLYEAEVGTENAVAYRGQCVVMFEAMQLEFAGNRPPVIEVEVATQTTVIACPLDPFAAVQVQQDGLFLGKNTTWSQGSNAAGYDPVTDLYYVVTDGEDGETRQIEAYSVSGTAPTFVRSIALEAWRPGPSNGTNSLAIFGVAFDPTNGLLRVAGGFTANLHVSYPEVPIEYVWNGSVLHRSNAYFANTFSEYNNGARFSGLYAIYGGENGEAGWWSHGTSILNVSLGRLDTIADDNGLSFGYYDDDPDEGRYIRTADVTYIPHQSGVLGDVNIAWRWDEWTGYYDDNGTDLDEITGTDASDANRWTAVVYAPSRKKAYICTSASGIAVMNLASSGGSVSALSRDLTAYPEGMHVSSSRPFFVWNNRADALMVGDVDVSAGLTYMTLIDPDTMEVLIECVYENGEQITAPRDIGDGRFVCILGTDKVAIVTMAGGLVTGTPITLREIVEDVCTRAGLPAENLDATAGTDLVDGYKIATQSTARAAIEALRPAFFFDMAESGSQLVLKKRGGASVATIDSGELGAHVFALTQSEQAPAYELEHVQEIEVPRTLEVVYIDYSMDYDNNVQSASRATGTSKAPLRIDVPVVMTADKALSVAWTNLLQAHANKSAVKFSLSHAYAALDPADPIVVPLSGGEAVRLRIERVVRARPMLELEAVIEDVAEIYSQDLDGGAIGQPPTQGTPPALSDSVLAIMDLPPLREADDVLGVYLALSRAVRAEAWPGGVAYKSVDGGVNYSEVYSAGAAATVGITGGALGDWVGGNRWDDESLVSVTLSSGTLSSATDLGVLNGMNVLGIQGANGWEIVQFVNAELVATNTWRISRLLRGRLGTERAAVGHSAGNRVVLLTAGSLFMLGYPLGEIGVQRDFLAVTSGQALADGIEQTFTANANSLRPLSPVHIAGTRDGDDLTVTWIRRARINAEWLDLYDVPLDEPTESYEIDILDGDDVVRTLTASTTTVEYTSAQQTTDFGSPQAEVSVAIYQMSSRVGRGHAGTATI